MKSIKPGRGPSRNSAVMSVFMAIFGVLWTVIAFAIGSHMGIIGMIFPLFGFVFIGIAIYNAIYHAKNATGKNRNSVFDITEGDEEPDPLNEKFGSPKRDTNTAQNLSEKHFCPYCGARTEGKDRFCSNCGNKLDK